MIPSSNVSPYSSIPICPQTIRLEPATESPTQEDARHHQDIFPHFICHILCSTKRKFLVCSPLCWISGQLFFWVTVSKSGVHYLFLWLLIFIQVIRGLKSTSPTRLFHKDRDCFPLAPMYPQNLASAWHIIDVQ